MRQLVQHLCVLFALIFTSPLAAQDKSPLVLAAASLQESLTEVANVWAGQRHPRPVISFGASSALARQIEAGAPADLFLSADEPWMDAIAAKGLIRQGTRAAFLTNRLVLIAPAGRGAAMAIRRGFPLARALGSGRLAIADPDAVPAGRYGKAALMALGVWPSVSGRIAISEDVRAALALVERGQTPLGVVYETDARASKAVRIVGVFPAATHPPIIYPLAVLGTAKNRDAEAFRRFLLSPQAKAIFRRYGFGTK
ncbi:molybdate ABC transporter substrate-binding protein [Sphingobium sp. SCG-1]|uniref:molybdate ABC transporter substrate-binding protein n=1 Tax=Sphingobium sp. SCG-1 TaxID=2072936 RepID=UPI000CD6AF2B|nr:molybdate ABC transporter substrate-binding protein [Sphingobium sp. SCG-1]AUW56755.1 molybdate ABC transporter substrate-binding protein [Sphingobium sp. SCG-1]